MTLKLDHRYRLKVRPDVFDVRCPVCCSCARFQAPPFETMEEDPVSGGWFISPAAKKITGSIAGRITCLDCGLNKEMEVSWPEQAFYQFDIHQGTLWAWDKNYLKFLRYWVTTKDRNEEVLFDLEKFPNPKVRFYYLHFLANLPKFILVKRNQAKIVKEIDAFLAR